MKQLDVTRQKNAKLNDLEEEAKEKQEHLLAKANEMRQEQEDEIKHLNEVCFIQFFSESPYNVFFYLLVHYNFYHQS